MCQKWILIHNCSFDPSADERFLRHLLFQHAFSIGQLGTSDMPIWNNLCITKKYFVKRFKMTINDDGWWDDLSGMESIILSNSLYLTQITDCAVKHHVVVYKHYIYAKHLVLIFEERELSLKRNQRKWCCGHFFVPNVMTDCYEQDDVR